MVGLAGRSQTCGLLVPNEVRCRAALQRDEFIRAPPRGRSARCTRGGVLCHIQVVKEQAGAHSLPREIGATKTKSPGALRRTRALEDRERIESLDDVLHPERARIGLA